MYRACFFCIRMGLPLLLTAFLIYGASSPASAQQQSEAPKISVSYQNADIRAVLQDIADQAGQTIEISKALNGRVSLNLTNASLDQALTQAMKGFKNFRAITMGNKISVLPIASQSSQNEKMKKLGNTDVYRSMESIGVTKP